MNTLGSLKKIPLLRVKYTFTDTQTLQGIAVRQQALDHWEYVLRQLGTQAKDFLGSNHSGFYNPLTLDQLLHRGHYLKHQFTCFLQTDPFPQIEPDQIPRTIVAPAADANVYAGTSLRNEIDPKIQLIPVPIGGHTLPPLPYDYNA